jgi:Outer membrane protein beta-barrel domain
MRIGILMLLLSSSCVSFSQFNYYIKDTSLIIVNNLLDNGATENSRICTVRYNKKNEQFLPTQIKEYGFKNGTTYVSRDIKISETPQRVFLERIINGKTKLYFFQNKQLKLYFLELSDSSFIEITPSDFRSKLAAISSSCNYLSDKLKLVHFNRFSLTSFVSQFNECINQYFPHFKFGITATAGFQTLSGYSKINNPALQQIGLNTINSSIGLFGEFPLISNKISLNTGFLVAKNGYLTSQKINSLDVDYILNSISISTPLFLRYSFKRKTDRAFFTGGITYTFNVKNENATFASATYPDHIELNKIDYTEYHSKHQLGFGIGAGKEYKLNSNHHLIGELRLNKYVGLSKVNTLRKSEIILLIGVNF